MQGDRRTLPDFGGDARNPWLSTGRAITPSTSLLPSSIADVSRAAEESGSVLDGGTLTGMSTDMGDLLQTTNVEEGVAHIPAAYIVAEEEDLSHTFLAPGDHVFVVVSRANELNYSPLHDYTVTSNPAIRDRYLVGARPQRLLSLGSVNRQLAGGWAAVRQIMADPRLIHGMRELDDIRPEDIDRLRRNWIKDSDMEMLLNDFTKRTEEGRFITAPGEPGYIYDLYYSGRATTLGVSAEKSAAYKTALRLVHHYPFNCAWAASIEQTFLYAGVITVLDRAKRSGVGSINTTSTTGMVQPTVTHQGFADKSFNIFSYPRPVTPGDRLYFIVRKGGLGPVSRNKMSKQRSLDEDMGAPYTIIPTSVNTAASNPPHCDRIYKCAPPLPADTRNYTEDEVTVCYGPYTRVGRALSSTPKRADRTMLEMAMGISGGYTEGSDGNFSTPKKSTAACASLGFMTMAVRQ